VNLVQPEGGIGIPEGLPPSLVQPGGDASAQSSAQAQTQRSEVQAIIDQARGGRKLSLDEATVATRSTADEHVQFLVVKQDGSLTVTQVRQGG